MRDAKLRMLLLVLFLAGLAGAADAAGTGDETDQAGGEVVEEVEEPPAAEGPDFVEPSEELAPDVEGATQVQDVYEVRRGDTLWDISERFLNSPWYWPKLWSYNPEITNPHWIYPGNRVKIVAGPEELPTRLEVVQTEAPITPEVSEEVVVEIPGEVELAEMVKVVGPYSIQRRFDPNAMFVRREGFATTTDIERAGVIIGGSLEKIMYSYPDEVYVRFNSAAEAKVGAIYSIYRTETEKPITHPITNLPIGIVTDITGTAKVLKVEGEVATVVITECYNPIEAGQYLGPWRENIISKVKPVPASAAVAGYIVATQSSDVNLIGEQHTVYVDKGISDGVELGNRMVVVRPGRQARDGEDILTLPSEEIATLIVIDAQDKMSTCLVTWSLRELRKGDMIEMRAGD